MAEATPALEIRNLHKRYGDLEVLKGISLTARDGDVISILGSSGSGKSTFLRCINLLENPHQGQILVAGEELKLKASKNGDLVAADNKQINRMRSEIGFVFQNFNLIDELTVEENVDLQLKYLGVGKAERKERVLEILRKVKLSHRAKHYPHQLSGGQQQRTSIGRAIVKNPDILLCDEPTGALDYKTSKDILKLIETINQKYGNTVIIVTHNDAIKLMADKVIKLRDGNIRKEYENTEKVNAEELDW